MPELPEVETARKHIAKFCEGKQIHQIITIEQGHGPRHGLFDEIIYEQDIPEDVKQLYASQVNAPILKRDQTIQEKGAGKKALTRKKTEVPTITTMTNCEGPNIEQIYQSLLVDKWVHQVCRKGKQLWIELGSTKNDRSGREEDKLALLLHFGMTGSIVIKDQKIPCYKSFHVVENEEWPPKFAKLELILRGDDSDQNEPIRLVLCDPRRLGYIKLRLNPRNTLPIASLAHDPLTDELPSIPELKAKLSKCQTNIKTLLLNQEKLFSGIGNYLADEILYQAKIHPLTVASELNEAGIAALVEKMKYIITTASDCDANYEEFPKWWIFHYRWEKGKPNGVQHMPNGNSITYETINGRTTAIVLKEQTKTGFYRSTKSEEENTALGKRKRSAGKRVETEEISEEIDSTKKRKSTAIKVETKEVVEENAFPLKRGRKQAVSKDIEKQNAGTDGELLQGRKQKTPIVKKESVREETDLKQDLSLVPEIKKQRGRKKNRQTTH